VVIKPNSVGEGEFARLVALLPIVARPRQNSVFDLSAGLPPTPHSSLFQLFPKIPQIGAKFQMHFGPDDCAWLGLGGQHRRRSALEEFQNGNQKSGGASD
jgi:hypothetical protein